MSNLEQLEKELEDLFANSGTQFLKLRNGERVVVSVDKNSLKFVEVDNFTKTKKVKKLQVECFDVNDQTKTKKLARFSKRDAAVVLSLVRKGKTNIEIQRLGEGINTRYLISEA